MKIIPIMFIVLALFPSSILASIEVQKTFSPKTVAVGDQIIIVLNITNPFGKEIPIRIVDRNILGSSGIEIKCMEHVLTPEKIQSVIYQPLRAFSSGKYSLEEAEITYTNPDSGKEETVNSGQVDVVIKKGNANFQEEGITSIYKCKGINMQSSSYSKNSRQPSETQQQNPVEKIQNSQQNQDTGAIKQEMDRKNGMEKDFQKALASNPEFMKKHQEVMGKGFSISATSINPSSDDSGTFDVAYSSPDGEGAYIKGEMENGTIKSMMWQDAEERQKIMKALEQNPEYGNFSGQLNRSGFSRRDFVFNQVSQNETRILVNFTNQDGKQANITADYVNGTIQNVKLKKTEKDSWFWLLALIPLTFAAYLILRKNKVIVAPVHPEEFDYASEARKLIDTAEQVYSENEKDAFELVSKGVRMYFSHKEGIGRELTSEDVLKLLENSVYCNDVKRCLDSCIQVEFAKHKPDSSYFAETLGLARKLVQVN